MSLPNTPLSEPVLHILLALAEESRHGYGVILRVEEWTEGRLVLKTGTLYTALRRLSRRGLISETPAPRPAADERRKYYRLTLAGREALAGESDRVQKLAALTRRVVG